MNTEGRNDVTAEDLPAGPLFSSEWLEAHL